MSPGYRVGAVVLALAVGAIAVGVMRGELPIGFRGSDERITGSSAVILGLLVLAGACRILYAAVTGE